MYKPLFDFMQSYYQTNGFIPLHAPCVGEIEKDFLNRCIDSTFVSSVGAFVDEFEQELADYTGVSHAIAVVNGTLGLFLALRLVGVKPNDLVLTQSLTFVATPNAIKMHQASPVFLDVDDKNYGLSADDLERFLLEQTEQKNQTCIHKKTGKVIRACVPMHTLGFACEIDKIVAICHANNIKVVEDAAESLGSFYKEQHTGTFGDIGVFSFNGNKVMTTGGGGMLVTNCKLLASQAKHLSSTAKTPHPWLFEHDEVAYNLRMPNLNAALGLAQLSKLKSYLAEKHFLAKKYQEIIINLPGVVSLMPVSSPEYMLSSKPNYWLNGFLLKDKPQRDDFLQLSKNLNIQSRPLWTPMHQLDIYKNELSTQLPNTECLAERLVNIPSGVKCG